MTGVWLIVMPVAITVLVIVLLVLWHEYTPWSSGARYTKSFAKLVSVQRRKWEPLRAWEARVVAALDELHAASAEFIAAVHRGDGTVQQVSARGFVCSLPEWHPAAIRYSRAKKLHH